LGLFRLVEGFSTWAVHMGIIWRSPARVVAEGSTSFRYVNTGMMVALKTRAWFTRFTRFPTFNNSPPLQMGKKIRSWTRPSIFKFSRCRKTYHAPHPPFWDWEGKQGDGQTRKRGKRQDSWPNTFLPTPQPHQSLPTPPALSEPGTFQAGLASVRTLRRREKIVFWIVVG